MLFPSSEYCAEKLETKCDIKVTSPQFDSQRQLVAPSWVYEIVN